MAIFGSFKAFVHHIHMYENLAPEKMSEVEIAYA